MVKYQQQRLNQLFSALADPTRRGILAALCEGKLAVSELAAPFGMSLPGFTKHLQILEGAGLLRRRKEGRVVECSLVAAPLQPAAEWLARYEAFWNSRLDALGDYLDKQEDPTWTQESRPHQRQPRRSRSSATTRPARKKSGRPGPRQKR